MKTWLLAGLIFSSLSMAADTKWIRMHSANFEMYSSGGEKSARETLQYFEQVRGFFLQAMPGMKQQDAPVRIVGFGSVKQFEPYSFNQVAAAYYHQAPDSDYIVMSHTGDETFPVAVHEYTHLVVTHAHLKFPPWLNEGLAELYSTLRPMNGKIVVGTLIPGRFQALQRDPWVPLTVILTADQNSAYYNEKDKAGSLYNEGWALTHMLALNNAYRPKFGQLMASINSGTASVQALETIYGKPIRAIENDLRLYLQGRFFQGVIFPQKLGKQKEEIAAEPAPAFNVKLILAQLANDHEAGRKSLEELTAEDPKRPEPFAALGYIAWRDRRNDEALRDFEKAFDLGGRGQSFLWDYGRMAERSNPSGSIHALSDLLSQEPERMDVRLELASAQLSSKLPGAAVATLAPIEKVSSEDAPRMFTILAYAQLQAGSPEQAQKSAERAVREGKTPQQREQAQRILDFLKNRQAAKPQLAVVEPTPALGRQPDGPAPRLAPKPSISGRFISLECNGQQAKVVLQTENGTKIFLIEDPNRVLVNGKSGETVNLTCGPQKPANLRIEFDPPGPGRAGIDGLVRVIHFE